MRMIDFAKMYHKLYVLENPKGPGKHFAPDSISINFVSVNKVNDWHFRLGHFLRTNYLYCQQSLITFLEKHVMIFFKYVHLLNRNDFHFL